MNRLLLACLLAAGAAFAQQVPWATETSSIPSFRAGDPSFLFAPGLDAGLVVGTDTAQQGVFLWPLGGQPTVLLVGQVNSADSRGDLLVVSSAQRNSLLVYRVIDGGLETLDTGNFNVPTPGQVALAQKGDGGFEVWVDTSSPTVQHFDLNPDNNGAVIFTARPTITVAQTPSGLAVDDRSARLYVAQPTQGVIAVEQNGTASFLLSIDAGQLGSAVGGIDLFLAADGGALLLTAAPNEGEVKVHSHGGGQATFLTSLRFGDVDGGSAVLTQPRFLDVFEQPVPGFPRGLVIVHDELTANYKVISIATIDQSYPFPPAELSGPGVDAGLMDAGTSDAGVTDGGGGGGLTGDPGGPPPSAQPRQPPCGCSGNPFALFPALLLLLWCARWLRVNRS